MINTNARDDNKLNYGKQFESNTNATNSNKLISNDTRTAVQPVQQVFQKPTSLSMMSQPQFTVSSNINMPTSSALNAPNNILQSSSANNLDYFNKYNHLSYYQKQQSILGGTKGVQATVPLSLGNNNNQNTAPIGVLNPIPSPYLNTINSNQLNAFNFGTGGLMIRTPTPTATISPNFFHPSFNFPVSSMSASSSPLNPSVLSNPQYLYSINNTNNLNRTMNKPPLAREQDLLDDGFMNLFKNNPAASSDGDENWAFKSDTTATTTTTTTTTSSFQSRKDRSNSLFDLKSAVTADTTIKNDPSQNLIDLDSVTDNERFNKLSLIELFDPLAAQAAAAASAAKAKLVKVEKVQTPVEEPPSQKSETPQKTSVPNKPTTLNVAKEGKFQRSYSNNDLNEKKEILKKTPPPAKITKLNDHLIDNGNGETMLSRIENFELVDLNDQRNELEHLTREINKKFEKAHQLAENNQQQTQQHPSNDEVLLNSITYNQILDYSPYLNTKDMNVKLTIKYKPSDESKKPQTTNILVSIKATIETILYNVMTLFEIDDLDIKKYLLKIHGLEEYIQTSCILGELKYINDCFNESIEPVFVLVHIKNANIELSKKTPSITSTSNNKSQPNEDEKLANGHLISKDKLDSLLKAIVQNRTLVEESIDDLNFKINNTTNANADNINQYGKLVNWLTNYKEKLGYIKCTVFNITYELIDLYIKSLELMEKKLANLKHKRSSSERQPLIMSTINKDLEFNRHYDYRINLSKDSSNDLSDEFSIFSAIYDLVNNSLHAVMFFVNCASVSFNWKFKVKANFAKKAKTPDQPAAEPVNNPTPVDIIQAEEKLYIDFHGLSRLNSLLNSQANQLSPSSELYLRFSITYGLKTLDTVLLKLDKVEKIFQRKSDSYFKKYRIQFPNIDLCLVPREACLNLQLCVSSSAAQIESQNNHANNDPYAKSNKNRKDNYAMMSSNTTGTSSTLEATNDKFLAWATKSLFDENLTLESGEYFLCFFEGEPSSICTTASNIIRIDSAVIQITFPKYDYVYRFPQANMDCTCTLKDFQKLPVEVKERLLNICQKSIISNRITDDEKDFISQYYIYMNKIQNALPKIFLALPSYDFCSIINFYAYLDQLSPLNLTEALELLLPYFPDVKIRSHAVKSIRLNSPDVIALYLPQLLEALKYERSLNSDLLFMFIDLSSKNIRFAHKLYWHLREYKFRRNDCMLHRYIILHRLLVNTFNYSMIEEIKNEVHLIDKLDQIGLKIKETKNGEMLADELDILCKEWHILANNNGSFRLPYNITFCVKEFDIKACSVISSFTMPLKLVFKNFDSTANSFYSIYKLGDDLRQDIFVLQLINVMNQLWLIEGLDLKVLTYTCLQTGDKRGFIEMITNAETLKEIQKGAVLNAFKKSCINDWLRFHNPKLNKFKIAVDNFTKSCVAYSVATYILGIGDRHNDNVMIKYTGHMFHIDFGKYMGDAQTFAGFKRDRTPILFTSDMFYVINQGKEPGARFQEFIEMCCYAFQILRKNHQHLLSLIQLMINFNIPGLNQNAIQFVYRNLMIDLSEDDASNAFKKLVHESISKFSSINFAIHTLAQPKTLSSTNYFSFITHTYNVETDCKILNISLEKRESINTIEMFKCLVTRENECESNEVYRTFDEFCELYQLLVKTYPTLRLYNTPSLSKFKDTKNITKQYTLVNVLLKEILNLTPEISQCDIIYTFFHPILRDQNQETYITNDDELITINMKDEFTKKLSYNDSNLPDIKGQIKVKLKYKDFKFYINCMQCRNLKSPSHLPASSLKPYVKCYLRPDQNKYTKRKVHPLYYGANPIFSDTIEYDINLNELKNRTLEMTVLNNKINNKEKIGSIEISLHDMHLNTEFVRWFDLR